MTPEARAHVLSVRAGEPGALEEFCAREHPEVYRLCLGFLAHTQQAEDASQDAMLQLIDHVHEWDPARSWRSWRTTVVLNLCRDRQRRAHTRRAEEIPEGLPSQLPSPHDLARAAEVRQILTTALALLSPREREAFVLHDLQGEETAEVAAALGVTEGSVRSLLTLARRRLRNLLGERLQRV